MNNYEDQKYYCNSKTLKETLNLYGVAIIPSVLDEQECKEVEDGMWNTLNYITSDFKPLPITRDNTSSWNRFYELFPLHSMLLQHWQLGHAQFVWNLRQNPKIVKIWQELWKTEELLTSFDGFSFHLPPETTNKGWFRPSNLSWLHTDQSFLKNGFECVQSWVTAREVRAGDATLAFLEGSHQYHGDFAKQFNKTQTENWNKLESDEEFEFYTKGSETRTACPRKLIKCPKGSMVFWDSRTIHCGQEPLKERPQTNFRAIVYLCYTPSSLISPADRKKKLKYLKEKRMTTHWPHKIKVFAVKPRTYGKPIPPIKELPSPVLSPLGLKLAGN